MSPDLDVLELLLSNMDEQEKYRFFKDKLEEYCINENKILVCYRIIRYIEFDLLLIKENICKYDVKEHIVDKLLFIIQIEMELLRTKIKHPELNETNNEIIKLPKQKWTDKKIFLVEIMYAIQPYVNNGNMKISALKRCFEYIFDIKLGNIYKSIEEISERKVVKTKFLEQLVINLSTFLESMDQ